MSGTSKMLTIAAREARGFLRMPLGYAMLAVYALVSGIIVVTLLFMFSDQLLQVAQQTHLAAAARPVVQVQVSVVTPYLLNCAALMVFVVPFLTMRAFAEEKRSRSLELLVSYPLSAWQIVAGKFLGVLGFAGLLLAINVLHLALIAAVTTAHLLPMVGGLLGLLLLTAALVAIGLFVSSLSMGQVEAAVLTLGLFLVLVMSGQIARGGHGLLEKVLGAVSPLYQFEDFGRGVLAVENMLFFGAVLCLFLALTLRGVDLLKWRG
jgi:ABC-2 type transport system permease protein